ILLYEMHSAESALNRLQKESIDITRLLDFFHGQRVEPRNQGLGGRVLAFPGTRQSSHSLLTESVAKILACSKHCNQGLIRLPCFAHIIFPRHLFVLHEFDLLIFTCECTLNAPPYLASFQPKFVSRLL